MNMQTESRRPPSLYGFFWLHVEHMLTSVVRLFRRSQREKTLLGTWEARPLRTSTQLPLLTSCNRVQYRTVEFSKLELIAVENKRGVSVRRIATGSEYEKWRNGRPESVLDNDDDDYTPSTPTRGNHSIYSTLALQGKAISPVSPTSLVRPALSVALRILHIPQLSLRFCKRTQILRPKKI